MENKLYALNDILSGTKAVKDDNASAVSKVQTTAAYSPLKNINKKIFTPVRENVESTTHTNAVNTANTANAAQNNKVSLNFMVGDDTPTQGLYYALYQTNKEDPEGTRTASNDLIKKQMNPSDARFDPYLYNPTNNEVLAKISEIGHKYGINWDFSGGITEADIEHVNQYADYTNLDINNKPKNSGNDFQQLAYLVNQLYDDEETTRNAETELERRQELISKYVKAGMSDNDIKERLAQSEEFPTLKKLDENKEKGIAVPVNRALGYGEGYDDGLIWLARNNDTSGNIIVASGLYWGNEGKMWVPDAAAEAAWDPYSEAYHPYAHGATLDILEKTYYPESGIIDQAWLDLEETKNVFAADGEKGRKEYGKIEEAVKRTNNAKAELEDLKKNSIALLEAGNSPEEIMEYYFGHEMKGLSEDYKTLYSMEGARQRGEYVSLTETVDFAKPYFETWLKDYAEAKETEKKAYTYSTDETEEEKTDFSYMYEGNTVWAEPNADFDVSEYTHDNKNVNYADFVDDINKYRNGWAPSNADASAFVKEYDYLFAGEVNTYLGNGNIQAEDMRNISTPIAGTEYYKLLKKADEAQKAGVISQYDYVDMLIGMAREIKGAGDDKKRLNEALNTPDSTQHAFLKTWNEKLTSAYGRYDAEIKARHLEQAKAAYDIFENIENGNIHEGMSEEEASVYGLTEEGVASYMHAFSEVYTKPLTNDQINSVDPNHFNAIVSDSLDKQVSDALTYSESYTNLLGKYEEGSAMYDEIQSSANAFVTRRANARLMKDVKIAATFGVQLEAYYNSLGYDASNIRDYQETVIAEAVSEFEMYSSVLNQDVTDIFRTMADFEQYEAGWGTENFVADKKYSDEEIQAAVEAGEIDEEQALLLKEYQTAIEYSNQNANSTQKEYINKLLYDRENEEEAERNLTAKALQYAAKRAQDEVDVYEKGNGNVLIADEHTFAENRTKGLFFTAKSGVELGAKEHALTWVETYYAFTRSDREELERRYRSQYTREEVRANIEKSINSIEDKATREALQEEYYYFIGDIYDFNFDFTTANTQNMITRKKEDIQFFQEELRDVLTESQYDTAMTISSATNSTFMTLESLATAKILGMSGLPMNTAGFTAAFGTTGLTSMAGVINPLMDAGVSGNKARMVSLPVGAVNASLEYFLDTNLSPYSPHLGKATLVTKTAQTIADTASPSLIKTMARSGMGLAAQYASQVYQAAGTALGVTAMNQMMEVTGEIAQEAATRMAINRTLISEGKWDRVDRLTWDEVWELSEATVKSGLIQFFAGEAVNAPVNIGAKISDANASKRSAIREIILHDTITGKEYQQFVEACNAMDSQYAQEFMEEAGKQAEVDRLVVEKMGERKEEITSLPEFEQRKKAEEDLHTAAQESIHAAEELEQTEREYKAASEQLSSEDIPSPETIEAVSEAQEHINASTEEYEKAFKREQEAEKLFADLNTFVKVKEKELHDQVTNEAKAEVIAKYQELIKAEADAKIAAKIKQQEEIIENERKKFLKELGEKYGYNERRMERLSEKAEKFKENYIAKEATDKQRLLEAIQKALPAYNVRYEYNNENAAGWVVREGANGEFVLNGDMDYDTLSGSVAAHELVHVAEDSGVYNELSDTVKTIMFDGDQQKEQKAIEHVKKEYAKDGIVLNDEQAFREVIAESVQDMFRGRTEWVKTLVNEKPNLATRIFDWVKNKVDEMKLLYKEGQEAAKTYRSLVKVRKLLSDAIREAGQRIEKETIEDSGNVKTKGTKPVETVPKAVEMGTTEVQSNTEATAETAFTEAETANATNAEQTQTEEEKPGTKTVPETVKEAKLRSPKDNKSLVKEDGVLTETKVDTEYDEQNTPEEEALLEEAKKDEDEYMSATDDELMKSGGNIELSDGVEQVESNTRDTFGLMNKKTVADDWSAYAVEKLGWSAAKDKINGYAQSIGFDGEQDMFRSSLLIPIEWFVERGLGEEGYTADMHKAAAQEFMLEQPEAYAHMLEVLDGKAEQEIATEQSAEQADETFSAMEELSDETKESTNNSDATEDTEETVEEESARLDKLRSVRQGYSGYEFALKRRINASERARKAARLLRNSEYYRENGMWTEYAKTVAERFGLGDLNVKATTPDTALKQLAANLGIAVYDSGFMAGIKEFAAYDKRASSFLTNNKSAANDFAAYAFAIGEKLKELTKIEDLKDDYTVADFVNDYLLRDESEFGNELKAYAKEFRAKLTEAGKEFVQALDDARDQIKNFAVASAVDKMEAFLVSRSERKEKRDFVRNLIIGVIDQTYSAELVDQLTGSHELRKAAAYLPYAKRRAERILEGDSFVDVDGNRTGEDTLKTAIESIKKSEQNEFQQFLFAREVLDRYNMGKAPFTENGGMTKSIAEETLAELTKKYPHFEEAGERYNAWWDNFMQTYMVAEGFISPEDYQRMSQAHPNYVSLAREITGSYKITGAKGNSDLRVYYPLENAIGMVQQFVNKVMQNRFARVFDELYNNNDDLGVIAMQLPVAKESIIKKNYDDALKFFMDMDDKSDTVKASSNTGDLLTVYRADGSIVQYDVRDRALFELLSGLSAVKQNEALQIAGVAYKALSFVTGTMSKLTTGINPLFIGKNIIRDFQKSVNYGTWAGTYADGLWKWIHAWADIAFQISDTAKDYIALGGGEWERLNVNTTKGVKKYKDELFTNGRSIKQLEGAAKLKRIVHNATTGILDFFGSTTEAASRYAEYKYGKHDLTTAAGRQEAFMAAQEVTVDFQRSGKYAKWLKAFVPFANATIQGTVQNVRMFTDAEKDRLKPRLQKMAFNNMLMGALSAVMCRHFGNDEDKRKYDEMTDDYKQNFILIPLPDELGKEYIALPVSQDWFSRMFYEFGRRCATGEIVDKGIGRDMVKLAVGIVSEVATETTTITSPIRDIFMNEKWNGSPVVKDSLLSYAPEGRYDVTTAGLFRNASRGLVQRLRKWGVNNDSKLYDLVTPLALEYLAQQYTGVYGQLIIPAISPEKYTGNGKNILRSFADTTASKFSLDADAYNIVTDRFYDICDKVEEMSAYIDNERSYAVNPNLSDEELKRIFDEVAASDNKGGIIYNARQVNKECTNKISAILMRNDLTEHEKRVLVEEQNEIRNAAYREVLDWFDPIELKVSGNTYRAITGISDAEKRINSIDSSYKADYDSGEAYMLEAVRLANLPENANKSSTLPIPNYAPTRTIDKVSYTYDLEKEFAPYMDGYKAMYEEAYRTEANKIIMNASYRNKNDEEKTQLFARADSKANEEAKEWLWKQIDTGIEKTKGKAK